MLLALPAGSGADRVGRLRAARTALASRERAAVLQLYALNTSLDRAHGRLADVESALAAARHERATARRELRIAQRTLGVAEARLAAEMRALYERDSPDVLSVMFGASSLDDLISGLDNATQVTSSTGSVIEQTRQARARVVRVLAALDRRAARLASLRAAAAARTEVLARSQAERSAYIQRLRSRQRLTERRIGALEAQAKAAEAASTVVTVRAQAVKSISAIGSARPSPKQPAPAPPPPAASPAPPPPPAAPAPIQPASGSGKQLTVVATAYSLHGGTASGLPTGPGVVAVDPTVIPLGTRMFIPGYGPGIAADTGTAIKGLRIDLWFPTLTQAESWGRRTVTITLR